jgi:hypothetical protein
MTEMPTKGQPFHIDIAGKPQSEHTESAAQDERTASFRLPSEHFGPLGAVPVLARAVGGWVTFFACESAS